MKFKGLTLAVLACMASGTVLAQQSDWKTANITGEVADMDIQTDGLNNAYIAYSLHEGVSPRNVYVVKLDPVTQKVSDNLDISNKLSGYNLKLAVDKNNQTSYVLFQRAQGEDGKYQTELWSLPVGGEWQLVSSDMRSASLRGNIAVAVAPNSDVYVAYQEETASDFDGEYLKLKKYQPSSNQWVDISTEGMLPPPPEGSALFIRDMKMSFAENDSSPYITYTEYAGAGMQTVVSKWDTETGVGSVEFEGSNAKEQLLASDLLWDSQGGMMLGGRIKVSDVYHQPALYSVSNDNPVQLYTNTEFNAFDAHATQTLDRSKTVLTFRDDANDYKPTVVELDGSGVQLDSTAFDYDIDFNQAAMSKDDILYNVFTNHNGGGMVVKYKTVQ